MILFLDIDGVLHRVNQVDLFSREEHLARVLRDFRNSTVNTVLDEVGDQSLISSSRC